MTPFLFNNKKENYQDDNKKNSWYQNARPINLLTNGLRIISKPPDILWHASSPNHSYSKSNWSLSPNTPLRCATALVVRFNSFAITVFLR